MKETHGEYEGEVCNRDGCLGIIEKKRDERTSGCSCHINPPCGYCTAMECCPECDWDAEEEADAEAAKHPKVNPVPYTPPKRKTIEDLDNSKIDWFISGGWHSGMEITGVYPEGITMEDIKKRVGAANKESMAKFLRFGNGTFTLRYFTD